MSTETGVVFPTDSTSATARSALAAALASADSVGSRAAAAETDWRRNYGSHFRRAVEAGLIEPRSAISIAKDGLAHLHAEFEYVDASGETLPLDLATVESVHRSTLTTKVISGCSEPERELSIPYRGERLSGPALSAQLDTWVTDGVITVRCAEAVREVGAHPEWLSLEGDTVVLLGAGSQMGPMRSLARWGATIAAIDLPRGRVQAEIDHDARSGASRVLVPVHENSPDGAPGADVLHELSEVAEWIRELPGRVVLGNYCYADGPTHVRLAMAGDTLAEDLLASRPDSALAFLATPTDVFAVDKLEVAYAQAAYARWGMAHALRGPARLISGGRLLCRNYAPEAHPGVCDGIVPQQGPNYALAKRVHRWRATSAREAGTVVSMNVAPATRTRSVVKNRALAAAYAGAHRFGVEIFDPATSGALMATLLVHDLRADRVRWVHPWQDEAANAAHGGLWTSAYAPRSALGLAALMGVTKAFRAP